MAKKKAKSDIYGELNTLKEEYSKLQDHLADTELKYQTALSDKTSDEGQHTYSTNLQHFISNLFNQPQYSDLKILMSGGRQLYGHKLILASRSENWGKRNLLTTDSLDLSDIRYEEAYAMLKWVYTDEIKVDVEEEFLMDMVKVALQFKLESLCYRCQKALMIIVDGDNCEKIMNLAAGISAKMLKEYCAEYIINYQKNSMEDNENEDNSDNGSLVERKPSKRGLKGEFTCFCCCRSFRSTGDLIQHLHVHNGEIYPLKCNICPDSKFTSRKKLLKHLDNHNTALIKPEPKKKEIKCDVCGKTFRSRSYLKIHTTIHTGEKPFPCVICGKAFREMGTLRAHVRTHEGPMEPQKIQKLPPRIHKCDGCGNSFRKKSYLKIHSRIHSGEKPYTCEICGRSFREVRTLRSHFRMMHTDRMETELPAPKPFTCEFCGNSFTKMTSLKIHMRVHTAETPFPCQLCDKSFREERFLQAHVRIHALEAGIKPFVCDVCGNGFSHQGALKTHTKLHNRDKMENLHVCTVCGKVFTQKGHLKTHEKIHTGEKPHQCTYCGKTFTDRSSYNRHNKIHTGEKPHLCTVCGKSFIQRVQLVKHATTHESLPRVDSVFCEPNTLPPLA